MMDLVIQQRAGVDAPTCAAGRVALNADVSPYLSKQHNLFLGEKMNIRRPVGPPLRPLAGCSVVLENPGDHRPRPLSAIHTALWVQSLEERPRNETIA